jgi:hypothetical protein
MVGKYMNNRKRIWKEAVMAEYQHLPERTEENFRIPSVLVKIRTKYFTNTSQEHYTYAGPSGGYYFC